MTDYPTWPKPGEINEWVENQPTVQNAKYLHALMKVLVQVHRLTEFEAERVAELADQSLLTSEVGLI